MRAALPQSRACQQGVEGGVLRNTLIRWVYAMAFALYVCPQWAGLEGGHVLQRISACVPAGHVGRGRRAEEQRAALGGGGAPLPATM